MLKIVSKNVVKEGKVEEFKNLAKELVRESLKEEGCVAYSLNEDINNKNVLTFIEEWKDKEAIEVHNNSKHFTSIVPKLKQLKEGDSELNIYKTVF